MNLLIKRKYLTGFSLIAAAGFFTLGSGYAQTATAAATPTTDEKVTLEKFEVTGSRISRTDAETPSPVVRFKSSDIQTQGFTSLSDFVQSLPFNSGNQGSIIQTASFTRGAATINPRGLGSQRFLVLLNGRRGVT
jgi:iron complex outermembrane receptor protein